MKLYFITLPHEKQTLFTFVNSLLIVEQYHEEKRGEWMHKSTVTHTLLIVTTHNFINIMEKRFYHSVFMKYEYCSFF